MNARFGFRDKSKNLTLDGETPAAWLQEFEARHGRPLRVLHVGNIANNAYLNAKFLRAAGVDAHVFCYDYYHVTATPEWEEVEIRWGHGDDFRPHFSSVDIGDYRRPDWFVNCPLVLGPGKIAELWGERPPWHRRLGSFATERALNIFARIGGARISHALGLLLFSPRTFLAKLLNLLPHRLAQTIRSFKAAIINAGQGCVRSPVESDAASGLVSGSAPSGGSHGARDDGSLPAMAPSEAERLIALYDDAFPDRVDRLTGRDATPYLGSVEHFRSIFQRYDIIECYATDPIHALIAGKRPYIAFEHGTLRHFTVEDDPYHRLTALAYRLADHTFITNGDCLAYAEQLGMEKFSPMIHPVDVEQHRDDYGDAIRKLRLMIDGDLVLFCPTRHDWDIKGTDRFIRALPIIKRQFSGRVRLVLVDWGTQVDHARRLLADLGCSDDATWRRPMSRISMIKHMRAADAVFDQMVLPVFGSTAPQAIAAGVPVIGSYVPEETQWLIPEPAPILSAFTPEEVAAAVLKAIDPVWRSDYERRAREWTDAYHSPDVVIREHLKVYRRLLEPGATSAPRVA